MESARLLRSRLRRVAMILNPVPETHRRNGGVGVDLGHLHHCRRLTSFWRMTFPDAGSLISRDTRSMLNWSPAFDASFRPDVENHLVAPDRGNETFDDDSIRTCSLLLPAITFAAQLFGRELRCFTDDRGLKFAAAEVRSTSAGTEPMPCSGPPVSDVLVRLDSPLPSAPASISAVSMSTMRAVSATIAFEFLRLTPPSPNPPMAPPTPPSRRGFVSLPNCVMPPDDDQRPRPAAFQSLRPTLHPRGSPFEKFCSARILSRDFRSMIGIRAVLDEIRSRARSATPLPTSMSVPNIEAM